MCILIREVFHTLNIFTWYRIEMLRLSDSYCERQLKRLCEKIIWQNMSVENVTYLMMVADKFKAEVS